ncbi:MAG: putative tricarboxylic transport rane protein [Bradyrhizobium sp.]|nr:putative tricarboxylic transport rane protein [Bradyrhizobium sp.]
MTKEMKSRNAARVAIVMALLGLAGFDALVADAAAASDASNYPSRAIQLIVPFTAGGGTDLASRAVATYLSNKWGRPINVVNVPGAGGAIGTAQVLKGKADGYTILANNGSSTDALLAGNTNLSFSVNDYRFVATVVNEPFVFLVKADSPFKDMKDLDEWVRQNPEKLTFGTTGPTSIQTISVIQWLDSIGVDYSKAHLVPVNGGGELLPMVAGGHVILGVQDVTGAAGLTKAGQLKILAVTGLERSTLFPDVPTLAEQGVNGVTTHFWSGFSFAVGISDAVVQKWESAIKEMLDDPQFQQKLKLLNAQGKFMDSPTLESTVKQDVSTYTQLLSKKLLVK